MSFVFFDSACEPADRDSRVIDLKNLSVILNNNDFSQTGSVINNNTGDTMVSLQAKYIYGHFNHFYILCIAIIYYMFKSNTCIVLHTLTKSVFHFGIFI